MESPPSADTARVIAPPPFIYLAGILLGLVLHARWPLRLPGVKRVVGAPLIAAGVGIIAASMGALRRANTEVEPWKPTTAIVSSGPYAFSRNPIYVGLSTIYAGAVVLTRSLWLALLAPAILAVMRRGVIDREERYLERRFGDPYTAYKRAVRRWL